MRLGEADNEEFAPLHTLGFLPVVRTLPRTVWRVAALADDPFGAKPTRFAQNVLAFGGKVGRVPDRAIGFADEHFQTTLSLLQRHRSEVLAVDREQVEREVGEAAAIRSEVLESLEVGKPFVVYHAHFAIERRSQAR